MTGYLDNSEIDALLELFRAEGVPEELAQTAARIEAGLGTAGGQEKVRPLDLLKPNRFTRTQLQAIERIQEMVAKKVAATISERMHVEADCDCVGVEQLAFSTWLGLLDRPIALYTLQAQPMGTPAVMTFSTGMLYGAVDCILGGTGKGLEAPGELSDAEYSVAEAFVGPVKDQLAAGLSELSAMRFEVTGRFTNPNMAQVLPLGEVVLSLHYQITGDCLVGDVRLCLPYSLLATQLERFASSRWLGESKGKGEHREAIAKGLRRLLLDVSVRLGETGMTLRDLLSLEVGDVVPIGCKPGEPVVVPVQDRPKFRGRLGVRGTRYAVDIQETLAES
ncbi:MAG: FliM/FliN family flagellar motor switch protein [Planctomycetota bacterium]